MTELIDNNLKKHVAAIHISNRLTLTQRKASNVLLYHAYEDLLTKRTHKIRVKDLAEAIGFNTHNLEPLKEALKTLAQTVLEWNILNEAGYQDEWGTTTLLAQAKIKDGYCIYAYSPELCEKLYKPEIYALLNLSIQKNFSSGHALALYENCLRYRRVGTTGWITVENMKRLLGVEDLDYYQDFRKLNNKIIKPAVDQVNRSSDLFIEVHYQRDSRKVGAVRFMIKDNPQMPLFTQRQIAVLEQDAAYYPDTDIEDRLSLVKSKLKSFGLTAKQINEVIARHDLSYVEGNISIVERDLEAGKIHNLPAYLLAAMRQDYRSQVTQQNIGDQTPTTAQEKSITPPPQHVAVTLERLKAQFMAMRLQAALDNLSEQQRDTLQQAYVARIEKGKETDLQLIRKLYRQSGLKSKIVESHFRAFARQQLLAQTDKSEFIAYASTQGYDLPAEGEWEEAL